MFLSNYLIVYLFILFYYFNNKLKMCILITGGQGYIGSHISKLLKDKNENILILDKVYNNFNFGINLLIDITNIDDLDELVFSKYNITNIIHCAGSAFVGDSFINIDKYYNNNLIGTINILNMMVKYNITNIVFSSSCSVYGNAELPITEDSILNPISPYGLTKKICEDIILNYSKIKNIKYVILRYFNVAGNDFDCIARDNKNNFGRIIPTIILKGINNQKILINGNNFNTKDGTCIRNYIHVLDLAEGHIKALDYILDNKTDNLICNLGCDENYTILEIINIIEKHLDKKIDYEFREKIDGDPAIVYCENTLSKEKLNWKIKYNINDIVKSYIGFYNS